MDIITKLIFKYIEKNKHSYYNQWTQSRMENLKIYYTFCNDGRVEKSFETLSYEN